MRGHAAAPGRGSERVRPRPTSAFDGSVGADRTPWMPLKAGQRGCRRVDERASAAEGDASPAEPAVGSSAQAGSSWPIGWPGSAKTADPDDFALDAELIKTLASDSRRDILRLLHKRKMTLTELAAALSLKKATVLEHLKKLAETGLVRRLEDDRLWVYYELSPRGKRVVSPGRTRFYLIMGLAAAAIVLGGVVAALVYANLDDAASSSPLAVDVEGAGARGDSLDVQLRLRDGQATDARAYLLTAEEVAQLKREDRVVSGIPLDLAEAQGNVGRFRAMSAVPAGTYFVYVVDEAGRDNLDALTSVRIPSLNVTGPSLVWKSLDEGAEFRVALDGAPANGTLLLVAAEGGELPTLDVRDGRARLDAVTLDRLVPAVYNVQWLPSGERYWIALDVLVEVREPLGVVQPAVAPEGRATAFTVRLTMPHGAVPERAPLYLEGLRLDAARADPAVLTATLPPQDVGAAELTLGRYQALALDVRPDVLLAFARTSDGALTLNASRQGEPLAGALLELDGVDVDATDENGTVRLAYPAPGTHRITLTANGDPVLIHSRAVTFDGQNVTEAKPRLAVGAVTARAEGKTLVVNASLENRGIAPEAATLAVLVDATPVFAQAVDLDPLSTTERSLRVRAPLTAGSHAVEVRLQPMARSPVLFDAGSTSGSGGAPASPPPNMTSDGWSVDYAPASSSALVQLEPDERSPIEFRPITVSPPTAATPGSAVYSPDTGSVRSSESARTPGPALWLALGAVGVALALRRRLNRS